MNYITNHLKKYKAPAFLLLAVAGGIPLITETDARPSGDALVVAVVALSPAPGDTIKPVTPGKLSRRARVVQEMQAEEKASGQIDTSFNMLAAIRALPRDSSARLAQFLAVRTDPVQVDPLRVKPSPLYLAEPLAIRYRDVLDSATWSYRVKRTIDGWDTKVPLDYSFKQYVALRLRRTLRANWETMAQAYTLAGEAKTGLGELFGKVTNIQIPVPKNPIFSIFGPNVINLHINGGVDVTAGFRNTKSDLIASNPLAQSRSEPEFKQDVQVTVEGQIGDKLKINADWDTKRTFEYENQLRVKYTGYEDEMIQSVEAGNVSLPLSSSFISSSQALFGIKAAFQFGPLKLTTIASQKKGEIKELSVSGGARPTPFTIRAPDYSKDHFFVDSVYATEDNYDRNYLQIPANPDQTIQIRDIEVWVTKTSVTYQQGERSVVAYIDRNQVQFYQDSVRRVDPTFQPNAIPGQVEVGQFIKLQQGVNADYVVNPYAGIISMNVAVAQEQAIAVAYTKPVKGNLKLSEDVGNFGSRTTDTLRLVLKLVKPRYLDPSFTSAWKLQIRNRYPLGGRGIKKDGFDLNIQYEAPGGNPVQAVLNNVTLLQMFGLDRFTEGSSGSDGKFDYLPGITVDENRGELIFPTLEPFDTTSIRSFLSQSPNVTAQQAAAAADSFSYAAIYDTTYTGAINNGRNKFVISGNFTPSVASTYSLGYN
ncbi:MAG TPA: cell surface protein SprA, partial [Bacteroidota bacterium]